MFFMTADQLVPEDTDTQVDIYDARICEPENGNPCITEPPPPLPPCGGEHATASPKPPHPYWPREPQPSTAKATSSPTTAGSPPAGKEKDRHDAKVARQEEGQKEASASTRSKRQEATSTSERQADEYQSSNQAGRSSRVSKRAEDKVMTGLAKRPLCAALATWLFCLLSLRLPRASGPQSGPRWTHGLGRHPDKFLPRPEMPNV